MQKIRKYLLLVCVISVVSCSDSIMNEIDTNPNAYSSAPLNTLLPNVITRYSVQMAGGSTARSASYLSEQTTHVLGGSALTGLSGNSQLWETGYLMLTDLEIIKEKAETSNAWVYVGISQVIKAFVISNLVDLYGDIPYTEALRAEITNPKFDPAPSIYSAVQDILDDAIVNLEKDAGSIVPGADDMIFNGNKAMWIKTAYGLKARLYNRLSNVDPDGTAASALESLSKSFTENEKFAFTKYVNTLNNGNPFSISQNEQPGTAVGNGIFNTMKHFSPTEDVEDDPRATRWFTRVNGELLPAPNGTAVADFQEPRLDGAFYSKPEILKHFAAPQTLLGFPELAFIEAEAKLRLEDSDGAYDAYQKGVKAALKDASTFNSSGALSTEEIDDYMALPEVSPGAENLTERHIIYQKYIYFFLYQPIEAYNEFRRSGLFTVTDPGGSATRFPYPTNEVTRNRNTPDGIDDFSVLDPSTKLFWAK